MIKNNYLVGSLWILDYNYVTWKQQNYSHGWLETEMPPGTPKNVTLWCMHSVATSTNLSQNYKKILVVRSVVAPCDNTKISFHYIFMKTHPALSHGRKLWNTSHKWCFGFESRTSDKPRHITDAIIVFPPKTRNRPATLMACTSILWISILLKWLLLLQLLFFRTN